MMFMRQESTRELTTADATERLMKMWLHGRSRHTQNSYRFYAREFLKFVNKPLHLVSVADVQGWQETLTHLSPGSQRTALAIVKSLLSYGHKLGILPVNVGLTVRPPKAKDSLNERILSELEVQTMIALETDPRNRAILRLLYSGGLRVSEVCQLKWKDINQRGNSGQVTVVGKGSKTRTVLLPPGAFREVCQLRGNAGQDDPVFKSKKKGHLDRSRVLRIVGAAGKRAGIPGKVSPHWLRHAHASHSLDRGAPIHLVQKTLGHESVATTSRYLHARPTDSSGLFLPD
jgi:integrase/recombinase XerD